MRESRESRERSEEGKKRLSGVVRGKRFERQRRAESVPDGRIEIESTRGRRSDEVSDGFSGGV